MVEQVKVESHENVHAQRAQEHLEDARERASELWKAVSEALAKPPIGATVAGATVLAAGALWGVTEAAFAGAFAWAVFRTLRKRGERKPRETVDESRP
jgi:hypothetical protein